MFVNETRNDVENNVKASATMTRQLRLIMLILSLLFIVSGGVWLGFGLYNATTEEVDITAQLIVIICGIVLFVFLLCFNKIQRKALESSMQGKEASVRFEFRDDGYEVVSVFLNESLTGTVKGNYYAVTECREDKELWLLYFNKANVYLMLKSGMQEGTAEDFTAFLKERLGNRYKVVYKKKK